MLVLDDPRFTPRTKHVYETPRRRVADGCRLFKRNQPTFHNSTYEARESPLRCPARPPRLRITGPSSA